MSEEKREKYVHGNKVAYEKEAENGINYLDNQLESEYAQVFFEYANHHNAAPFEDQSGRKYLLKRERDYYTLERK